MHFVAMGKCKFQTVAILFTLTVLTMNCVDCYIVNLYDKIHFYELDVEQFMNGVENFKQSFNYEIDDIGGCLKTMSANAFLMENNLFKYTKDLNLDAEVLIYPNHEQTLSFIAKIKFQPTGSLETRGYELVFQQEGVPDKCIRIMLKDIKVSNIKSITFSIKDPSFMNLNNTLYSFFFGTVYVRPIVNCKNNKELDENLCALDTFRTEKVKIGISSEGVADLKPIEPDLCEGDVLKQTCIIRYIPKKDENYCMIMHPQSDNFVRLIGDTDVTNLNDEQQSIVNKAIENGKTKVLLADKEYQTSEVQKDFVGLIYNVESFYRQRLLNGLVIKFLKCPISINYVGLFDIPTNSNPCKNNSEDKFCWCNGQCRACSKITKEAVRYIPLNVEGSDKKLAKKSNKCDNEYFKSFSFDKVNMVKMFQNQPISINKIEIPRNSSTNMANRDTLPRLCFDIEKKDALTYTLNIILNDYSMIAKSSQIETSYSFSMYIVFRDKTPNAVSKSNFKNTRNIKTESILNLDRKIYANDSIFVENLTRGTYLIELVPVQRSAYCGIDECVDEGFYNNQIQCFKCSKLITFFYLNDNILTNNNEKDGSTSSKQSQEVKSIFTPYSKLKSKYGLRKKVTAKVQTFDVSKIQNSHFKCSIDSVALKNILNVSTSDADAANMDRQSTEYPDLTFYNSEIYSSVSLNSFNPINFLLPYKDMIMMDQNDSYEESIAIFESNLTTARLAIFSIVTIIILIVSFIAITYCVISGFSNGFPTHRKRVVVCMSVFIKNSDQKILSDFTTKFIDGIKKKFSDIEISKIDYDSERNNFDLIERADLIFYICGNVDEQEKIENMSNTIFGIKELHHDFNKIHFDRKCQEKTFNLIFQNSHRRRMPARSSSSFENRNDYTTNSKTTQANLIIDMVNQSNQISLTSLTENLPLGQKHTAKAANRSAAQSINPHKFLRIPKETSKLVNILLSRESAGENQDFSYVQKSKSLGSKFVHWMINKLYTYSLNKTYKNELKRNTKTSIFNIKLIDAET